MTLNEYEWLREKDWLNLAPSQHQSKTSCFTGYEGGETTCNTTNDKKEKEMDVGEQNIGKREVTERLSSRGLKLLTPQMTEKWEMVKGQGHSGKRQT